MSAMKYILAILFCLFSHDAYASISIDGSAGNSGVMGSDSLSLTTSNSNDIIVVAIAVNGGDITGVTATGLTFTKRADVGSQPIEYWTAIASSPLSSVSINIVNSVSTFTSWAVFGVSGINTSSPFDSNAVLPVQSTGSTITTLSTTNANTILLSFYRQGSTSSPAAGTGFTGVGNVSGSFALFQYQIVSSAQTNVSCGKDGTTTNADANGGIADALVAVSATAGNPPKTLQPILFRPF